VTGVLVWVGVALLGGSGAVARFLVDGAVAGRVAWRFPIGTLVVNLSGAVVLGLLTGLALGHDALLLVGTGIIGSYTTFSTWMLESQRLAEDGERLLPAVNLLLSLALGLGAAALGRAIA
jgi:CrcB protein